MGKALSFLLSEQNIFGGENTTVPLSQVKAGPFSKPKHMDLLSHPLFSAKEVTFGLYFSDPMANPFIILCYL